MSSPSPGLLDYFKLGKYDNHPSYGVFESDDSDPRLFQQGVLSGGKVDKLDTPLIREQVSLRATNRRPTSIRQRPDGARSPKGGAYTWLKALRYDGKPMEVGSVPRVAISYLSGNAAVKREVDAVLKEFNADISAVFSVLGKYAARAIESKLLCIQTWNGSTSRNGRRPRTPYEIPSTGEGEGLVEYRAARLALDRYRDKKIATSASFPRPVPARGTTGQSGP